MFGQNCLGGQNFFLEGVEVELGGILPGSGSSSEPAEALIRIYIY